MCGKDVSDRLPPRRGQPDSSLPQAEATIRLRSVDLPKQLLALKTVSDAIEVDDLGLPRTRRPRPPARRTDGAGAPPDDQAGKRFRRLNVTTTDTPMALEREITPNLSDPSCTKVK